MSSKSSYKVTDSQVMSSKCNYKLIYFNVKGRGETIRYVFAAAGIKYEDHRVEKQDWPAMKPKTPWGSLPVLEVNGKPLGQSVAIARFVAREGGLAGSSSIEQGLVDSAVDAITELREKAIDAFLCKDESKKPALLKEFSEQTLPTTLGNLDKFLHDKNYFVSDKLSLADLHFYAVAEMLGDHLSPDVLKSHPKLDQLYKRVASNPKIAEYLKDRPQTPF